MQREDEIVLDRQYLEYCAAESIQDPRTQEDQGEEERTRELRQRTQEGANWTQDRGHELLNDADHA
jgi:hypothetical protein